MDQQRTCWSYLEKENLPSPAIKHWLKAAMKGHARILTKAVGLQNKTPKGARSLDVKKKAGCDSLIMGVVWLGLLVATIDALGHGL